VFYIKLDICAEWSSFEEFKADNWEQFLERLELKFPEFISKEQNTMDQLGKLTCYKFKILEQVKRKSLVLELIQKNSIKLQV